mmetsp:Transcript_87446/g.167666  ORF Transcript_87446/g.167666 Transcript_87446/m.167666 type:complete len:240 (-) Transcript_87446:90-809(-)
MGACCSDVSKSRTQAAEAAASLHDGVAVVTAVPNAALPPPPPAPAPAAAPLADPQPAEPPLPGPLEPEEDDNKFISTVGELPKFAPPPRQNEDTGSEVSINTEGANALAEDAAEAMSAKEQQKQVKKLVKDFVKEMVRGKKMNVMKANGQLTTCSVSLTRSLDELKVKVSGQTRNIPLTDIEEMHAGTEAPDVDTPLDDMCATLMLASGDCISFRLSDINSRDTFILCLTMFCNNQGMG